MVKVGDIVSLENESTYYGGQKIPQWVLDDKWIITSISGDKVILGKNENGSHEINCPVNLKFVKEYKAGDSANLNNKPVEPILPQNPQTNQGGMQISQRGVELVAKYEGCRLEAYKCPSGDWTIGYGHTAGVTPGQKLPSEEYAMELLRVDLEKYGNSVNNLAKKGIITFPLTQNQFDALTSFCYNCGAGNLQKLVSGRNPSQVAEKFMAYTKGGGKVVPGLVRRREDERDLFLR